MATPTFGVGIYLREPVAVRLAISLQVVVSIVYGPSFAKSVEAPDEIIVDNAIPPHANDARDNPLSISEVLFREKMERHYSMPTLSGSSVSDTSALPTDATTNHRRRTSPRLSQGQRRHRYEAAGPLPEVPKTQLEEANRYRFVLKLLPLLK